VTSLFHALRNSEGTACFVFHDPYGTQREVKGEAHPESKIQVFLEIGGELSKQHPNGMKYAWLEEDLESNFIVSGGWCDCTARAAGFFGISLSLGVGCA